MSPKPKAGTLGPFFPSLRRGILLVDMLIDYLEVAVSCLPMMLGMEKSGP